MNEKDLLKKLNSLRGIKPGSDFKKMNRELLLTQIASTKEASTSPSFSWARSVFIDLPFQTLTMISQPALAAVLIAVCVLGGGVAGMRAAQNTKPGDSLYIAKIASEKTQLALTWDDKKKAQLGLEFAGNRAKELTEVLAESPAGDVDNDEVVEKLKNDFRKEITFAKSRIAKISTDTKKIAAVEQGTKPEANENQEEENPVFSANLEKDSRGLQTSEGVGATPDKNEAEINRVVKAVPTTTPEIIPNIATGTDMVLKTVNPNELLEQAKTLLSNEDYDATLSKLDEAGTGIDMVDDEVMVKGAEEEVSGDESTDKADSGQSENASTTTK